MVCAPRPPPMIQSLHGPISSKYVVKISYFIPSFNPFSVILQISKASSESHRLLKIWSAKCEIVCPWANKLLWEKSPAKWPKYRLVTGCECVLGERIRKSWCAHPKHMLAINIYHVWSDCGLDLQMWWNYANKHTMMRGTKKTSCCLPPKLHWCGGVGGINTSSLLIEKGHFLVCNAEINSNYQLGKKDNKISKRRCILYSVT